MLPLNAPLPTARYFPFQFDAGIQISIVISESDEGLSVAATRHASGPTLGSTFADVIVVDGRVNDVRLSQEPAAASGTERRRLTRNHATRAQKTPAEMRVIQRLVIVLLCCDYFARTGWPGTIPSTSCPFA